MERIDDETLGGIPEALRQCEDKALDVSLELELRASLDGRHVTALTQAIQRNKQITTVKFHLRGGWEEISPTNRAIVAELVTSVAPLPNLKEFMVIGDFAPIPAITALLLRASQLECLILQQFRNLKSCDSQVLVDFCRALQRHTSLKRLVFQPRIENRCEPQEVSVIEMLLEAVAEIAIQEVEIETNVVCLAGPPLVKVCNSSSLLVKLDLRPRGGVGIDGLQALARNTSIQELLVKCQWSEMSIAAVANLLRANAVVRKLTVLFPANETNVENLHILIQPVADALKANTTLSDLRIPFGGKYPSVPLLQTFVDVFRTNFTLQSLEVFHNMSSVQRANYDDIHRMEDKTAQEALLLGKRILYYTLLNRSGRGQLLGSAASKRSQWVDKIVEFSYSLDHLYFFLRTNPTLCSELIAEGTAHKRSSSPINARKRNRG